jgi:hypothetical protein
MWKNPLFWPALTTVRPPSLYTWGESPMSKSGCSSLDSPKTNVHSSSAVRWFTHLIAPVAASKARKASLVPWVGSL